MEEVWVVGGTGRTGHRIALDLAARGVHPVLIGRNRSRLAAMADTTGGRLRVAGTVAETAALVESNRPRLVVNTVGPFTSSAPPLLGALATGAHYIDLANDLATVMGVLARSALATAQGSTWVTGAGFGVTATECAVLRLCEDHGPAARVRVDMVPALASEAGVLGDAVAATVVDGLPAVPGGGRFQGRRYRDGVLAPARIGGRPRRLTTPGGDAVTTALMPLGELVAAQRASGAPDVESASSEAPTGALLRAVLPAAIPLLHVGPLRRLVAERLASARLPARPAPRARSWGHARVEWADGKVRESWLGLPEAGTVTAAVAAEIAIRLLGGPVARGAFTPGALFGARFAESVSGTWVLPETAA